MHQRSVSICFPWNIYLTALTVILVLGAPYDFAIDTWSIGCTLYELYTGKILFTGRTNNQMLRSMMECRGKFSLKMLKKAEFAAAHFDENLNFKSFEKDKITGRVSIIR